MLVPSPEINCCFKGIAVINFFWSSSFELPVCASLSDTRPFTYRVWDMLVDQNLYVQTICSYYEFPRQHKLNRLVIIFVITINYSEFKQQEANT